MAACQTLAFAENSPKDSSDDVELVYTSDRFGRVRFPPGYGRCNENISIDEPVLKGARVSSAPNGDGWISPDPLYQICLKFVAQNIKLVESLEGFPDIVGQQLFEKVHKCGGFAESRRALWLFFEAYGELVLKNLSLSGKHIVANDKLQGLLVVSCLRGLDLSHCRLGSDHELWSCIANLKSLQRLSLKDNCLSDGSLVRMSLPHRLLGLGLGKLSVLDLSCNPCITDKSIRCLIKFTSLRALNLSGTAVTLGLGAAKLISATNLELTSESAEFQKEFAGTEGWAAVVISDWIQLSERTSRNVKHLPRDSGAKGFYQTNTSRTKAAKQVPSKASFCGPFIFLEAKKTKFPGEGLERFVSNQRTTCSSPQSRVQMLPGKRKLSPLPSRKAKRQNNSSSALDSIDSDEEWAFLNDYVVKTDCKENMTNGNGPYSLINALDKCVGSVTKIQ